jgi:hypothetical protein
VLINTTHTRHTHTHACLPPPLQPTGVDTVKAAMAAEASSSTHMQYDDVSVRTRGSSRSGPLPASELMGAGRSPGRSAFGSGVTRHSVPSHSAPSAGETGTGVLEAV